MRFLFALLALLLPLGRLLAQPVGPPPSQTQILRWTTSNAFPMPFHQQAALDANAYAQNLRARGGTNMDTAGTLRFLQGGLAALYNTVPASNLIDAAFFPLGWNMMSGTQALTLRGRIGYGTNTSFTTNGLLFTDPSSMEFWHVPDWPTNATTIAITVSCSTNFQSSGYRWLFSQISTNGYTAGARMMLGYNSAALYPWMYNAGALAQGDALLSRYFNPGSTPGISQGAFMLEEQFRTIIVASDGTNVESWVDGLLAQRDVAGNLNATNWCNRWQLGRRSDNNHQFIGTIEHFAVFDKMLSSNEVQAVDFASRIWGNVTDIVVIGDSLSEFNSTVPTREWMAAAWRYAGRPASVRVHNHAYSGRQAITLLSEQSNSVPHRMPWNNWNKAHYFVMAGKNDVLNSVAQATAWNAISNMCWFGRSRGFVTHLCTDLPLGGSAAGYSTTKSNNVQQLVGWARGASNAVPPLYDYLWDFNQMFLQFPTVHPNDTNVLYDYIHPTLAYKDAMGALVGSNMFGGVRFIK